MTLIEKETALLKALLSDPSYGFQDDEWSFWEDTFLSFVNYINVVVRMEVLLPMYRFRYESEDYRTRVMELDTTRRNKHEAMISNVNMLNRLCDKYGIERFMDSTDDRNKVAELAGRYIGEVYFNSIGMSAAEAVSKAERKEYDPETVRKTLHKAA